MLLKDKGHKKIHFFKNYEKIYRLNIVKHYVIEKSASKYISNTKMTSAQAYTTQNYTGSTNTVIPISVIFKAL